MVMGYRADEHSKGFIEAIENGDLEGIKRVPKADVHNHSGLGMRFEKFVAKFNADIPYPPERMDGIGGMDAYMQYTAPYVDDRAGFEYLLIATLEEAIADGVVVLETSIDWGWLFDYNCCEKDFIGFICDCKKAYAHLIDFRPELGVFKGTKPEFLERYVVGLIETRVFESIDFYGEEHFYQPEITKVVYEKARACGLKTKFHAGEFGDAKSVFDSIMDLNPHELQHGITSYQNAHVMDLIKLRNIRLNICPSSNVVLGAVTSLEDHPIRQLYDYGVRVSVNTDDLLFFHSSVSEEFLKLYKAGIFNATELDHIRQMGLEESCRNMTGSTLSYGVV